MAASGAIADSRLGVTTASRSLEPRTSSVRSPCTRPGPATCSFSGHAARAAKTTRATANPVAANRTRPGGSGACMATRATSSSPPSSTAAANSSTPISTWAAAATPRATPSQTGDRSWRATISSTSTSSHGSRKIRIRLRWWEWATIAGENP